MYFYLTAFTFHLPNYTGYIFLKVMDESEISALA